MSFNLYCAVFTHQSFWILLDRMWINDIHYEPVTLSFRQIKLIFLAVSLTLTAIKLFHWVMTEKETIKIRIHNGHVWHDALNPLHVSSCKILHFVTSYMNWNRWHKQTLQSMQYELKIIFKVAYYSFSKTPLFEIKEILCILWNNVSYMYMCLLISGA